LKALALQQMKMKIIFEEECSKNNGLDPDRVPDFINKNYITIIIFLLRTSKLQELHLNLPRSVSGSGFSDS
jgi:hypothetical protein